MVKDLTKGNPLKLILFFSLPMIVGNLFQQFYNMADSIVVGQFLGVNALAAVGSTGSINFMILGFATGSCSGLCIPIAQAFGAGDMKTMRRYVTNAVYISAAITVFITAGTMLFTRQILLLMQTPANILEDAYSYIIVVFAGTGALMLYNLLSGILRALGDSKTPLYFLIIAAVLNIILDIVFVVPLKMGTAGAAYATIIAQAVSALLTVWVLLRAEGCIRLELRALRMTWSVLKQIVAVGIPAALQMAVTAFSNVFVQGYINYFGADCMSGWTAYTKVDQLVILPVQSISMAGTTFVGQNLGVGDTPRAKKGVRTALYLSFAVTAVLLVPVLLLAPELTAFFNQKPEVVSYGALLLRLLSPFYFFFCINQVYSAALRGAGNSQMPMWIMLGSFVVFRQIYLFVVANYVANEIIPIALSYPAGWFLCSAATLIYYSRCRFDKHRLVEDV